MLKGDIAIPDPATKDRGGIPAMFTMSLRGAEVMEFFTRRVFLVSLARRMWHVLVSNKLYSKHHYLNLHNELTGSQEDASAFEH